MSNFNLKEGSYILEKKKFKNSFSTTAIHVFVYSTNIYWASVIYVMYSAKAQRCKNKEYIVAVLTGPSRRWGNRQMI